MIKGIIIAPFGGLLIFVLAQIFLPPFPLCAVLGVAAAVIIVYITVISENIYFELDDDGTFRYFKKGTLQNTFELSKYRTGYYRRTEWGLFGSTDINLKLRDAEGEETEIDAGPLGRARFEEMYKEMEKYAIKDIEVLDAGEK
jgi:hypothetical protein